MSEVKEVAKVKRPKSFDWKVHLRDKKTGKISKVQDYKFVVNKNGPTWVERDGKKFHLDGTPWVEPKEVAVAAVMPVAPVVQAKVEKPVAKAKRKPASTQPVVEASSAKEGE